MSAHAVAWAARREPSAAERAQLSVQTRPTAGERGAQPGKLWRPRPRRVAANGRPRGAGRTARDAQGRGGAEGALRPAPLAPSPKETHPWPPWRVPPPAAPVALQRPTAETGALPTTPPASCASPKNRELTPSVQFLPSRQGQQPANVQGGTFISPVHSQQYVRYRKYYTDTSSSQASHNANVPFSKNIFFWYI